MQYWFIKQNLEVARRITKRSNPCDAETKIFQDSEEEVNAVKPVYNDHLMGYFSAYWG